MRDRDFLIGKMRLGEREGEDYGGWVGGEWKLNI
jgi:hypothetical protein